MVRKTHSEQLMQILNSSGNIRQFLIDSLAISLDLRHSTKFFLVLLLDGWHIREMNGFYHAEKEGMKSRLMSTPAFNALRPLLQCREKLGVKNWTLKAE